MLLHFQTNTTIKTLATLSGIILSSYLVCCPAIIAELITKEVDQIKAILGQQLMRCPGD